MYCTYMLFHFLEFGLPIFYNGRCGGSESYMDTVIPEINVVFYKCEPCRGILHILIVKNGIHLWILLPVYISSCII